jgi:hypothetical protein
MKTMTDNGGTNIVIIDADKDIDARRSDILKWKQDNSLEFELFLLPNDKDAGALEDLLENIINANNKPIFECWEGYEKKLVKLDIPGRTPPPLTTPAKKTKIYGYLEALLGESKSQKELIKEPNRDYENTLHWNLDTEYLATPLESVVIFTFLYFLPVYTFNRRFAFDTGFFVFKSVTLTLKNCPEL